MRILSLYATEGENNDFARGLDELISIMTTADEYGGELGSRVEATRSAFPETTKAIAEKRMIHYEKLLYEFGLTDTKPTTKLTETKYEIL